MKRLFTILLFPVCLQAAEPEADPSAQLREALRATSIQLRTAQTDLANAQATAAAADAKNKDLEAKLTAAGKKLTDQIKSASEDRTIADQNIATLNNRVADRDRTISELTVSLDKMTASYRTAAALAQTKEGERLKLATEAVILKRTIADRETKNIALFNVATEILDRYEKHALGKAILAKEPFVQTTRVKVENLVQGYNDRILDNRISGK